MTKLVHDDVLDAALDELATSNALHVCSGDPADRTAALSQSLATSALTGGDFTNANGDVSGRKATIAQQAGMSITATGTALHICLVDASVLMLKTTVTSQLLTSGGTVTSPAFDDEIADPS